MITKQKSLSALMHELDDLVSEVVRRNAADEFGRCACVSCDKRERWQDMDCAHLMDRGNMGTRYDLRNLAPACKQCNRYDEDFHKEAWRTKLGPEVVEELEFRAKSTMKFMRFEMEKGIELMKEKLKQLR